MQIKNGQDVLTEQPERSYSRQLKPFQEITKMKGVHEVIGDMCRFGLRHAVTGGPVRKRSWFATASPEIAVRLQKSAYTATATTP